MRKSKAEHQPHEYRLPIEGTLRYRVLQILVSSEEKVHTRQISACLGTRSNDYNPTLASMKACLPHLIQNPSRGWWEATEEARLCIPPMDDHLIDLDVTYDDGEFDLKKQPAWYSRGGCRVTTIGTFDGHVVKAVSCVRHAEPGWDAMISGIRQYNWWPDIMAVSIWAKRAIVDGTFKQ